MDQIKVKNLIFGLAFLALFILLCKLFSPFLYDFLWATILYTIIGTPFNKFIARLGAKRKVPQFFRQILGALCAILFVCVLLAPVAFVIVKLSGQVHGFINGAVEYLESHPDLLTFTPESTLNIAVKELSFGTIDLSTMDLLKEITSVLNIRAAGVLKVTQVIFSNIASLLVSICLIVFMLYFFLMDGKYLMDVLVRSIPIERQYTRHFVERFKSVSKHLLQGYFLVALYQGTVAYILFTIFHVKHSLLLACIVFVSSFIPIIGTTIVWLPVGIIRFFEGFHTQGILIVILSAILISGLDNLLRPILLTDRIKIHPLLILCAILGGLKFFGFNGLIIGPLILAFFFSALDIFQEIYEIKKEPVSKTDEPIDPI